MTSPRLQKVYRLLENAGLDGFLFMNRANLRYLCGFTGSSGALLVTPRETVFLTDFRYMIQAHKEVRAQKIVRYRMATEGIVEQVEALGLQRIGFESETLTYDQVLHLRSKSSDACQWIAETSGLHTLRSVKDAEELAAIAGAASLAAAAFEEVLPLLRPGCREREFAFELELAMRRRGAEEKAFDIIVASGYRGALPHGTASDKLIARGDLVTIDFGCRLNGYHSDETVTLAIGTVDPQLRRIYETVLEARHRALDGIRPGVALRDIDALARDYIVAQGYGDYFGHGLGHGLGLEVHEKPTISSLSDAVAEENMVFTVEPGIYLPERGGVRIEDLVCVTAEGCRRLTRLPKDFQILSAA